MFHKLNTLLSKRDKQILFYLLLFSIFISLIETAGVGVIMPFISVASDFSKIDTNQYMHLLYQFFGFESKRDFVVAFGVFLIFFYLFRAIVNYLYFYALARFSQERYHLLAYRLFENYMGYSYRDFIGKNSATLTKTIVNEANNLVQLLSNFLLLVSELFVVLFIYTFLLYINWKMTLLLTLFLGVNALIIRYTISTKIATAGEARERFQRRFYEIMNRSFSNFKIFKLRGTEEQIVKKFGEASYGFAEANIKNQALSHAPRLFLEAVGFSLVAVIVIYLVVKYEDGMAAALPVLMAFVLGLYRLMPSVNRIFAAYNQILFYRNALDIVHNDLIYEREDIGDEEVTFHSRIDLKNISFAYRKDKPILEKIDLTIRKGEKIGFVGESGSGKSTLIDIIIGLYRPSNGTVEVDGVKIDERNLKSWREKIGYIPQSIYLFDGTVAQNVAFDEQADRQKVCLVLEKAEMLHFLEKHHNGIDTEVGENGVKLSGGQKQRIAIARALYHDPELLVLDEATSALDSETEERIMQALYKAGEGKTMLIIAHRLSTLDGCDRIVKVEGGKIVG